MTVVASSRANKYLIITIILVGLATLFSISLLYLSGARAEESREAPASGELAFDYDILVKDGRLLDGSGMVGYTADVGIRNGYIYAIGDLAGSSARQEIEAQGLIVAPGFINSHSHTDRSALDEPLTALAQGVTTVILNPDGGGPADIGAQLQSLGESGLGINVGAYIGFNSVLQEVVGLADRRPTNREIDQMRTMVRRAMRTGASGVSSTLFSPRTAPEALEEMIRVISAARPWRTILMTDMHNGNSGILGSLSRTMHIAQEAGLVPVVGPIRGASPRAPYAWGRSADAVGMVKQANTDGLFTVTSVAPYLAVAGEAVGATGHEQALKRLLANPYAAVTSDAGAENVLDPAGAVGSAGATDSPGTTDPAGMEIQKYEFAHVLGRYVREQGVLSWREAIRKMTGLPAAMLGLVDRGFLAVGMAADLTIFDPETVGVKADTKGSERHVDGIAYVIVNGELALKDGKLTGVQAGRVLRRHSHAFSRPMNPAQRVRVSGKGSIVPKARDLQISDVTFAFHVSRGPNDARASGYFRMRDWASGVELESERIGKLQAADGWAAFAGRATVNGREERVFWVIVEEADPFLPGHPSVAIWVDGLPTVYGPLAYGGGVDVVTDV